MTSAQKEQIAAAIRAARRSRGLTQEVLADRIGRSVASVSNLERAQATPTLETLLAIADVLDVPVTTLLDFSSAGRKSRSRVREEHEIMDIVRSLNSEQLRIAKVQVEALKSMKK
ncbi:MAG: helix-turn-helix domain-containing protein [Hyphomonas sp.]|nr:helix-turn-helix domain-containing protein [Nitrospira sp.]